MLTRASPEDRLASHVQSLPRSVNGGKHTELEQRVRNASTTTKLAVADPLHRHELIGGDRELGLQEPARRKQLP